ncbi:hypothetical protein DMA12_24330 [Amycolatopsis balhimycina DSM 5908]|uniref:Lipoprotein n=1 Tax=Amycolatopsis balhimycina DSM 5908 TaxID=1081091 RepID=A0A428WEH0_AMYBA|nr:hypothetical protein [Amycolatopsis balhimycina]RSM41452.1 hypothetical protein DMA12_24330 [Amycolatopsis balhimycina DSM 5908]
MRPLRYLAAITAAVLMAGCSTPPPPEQKVATLQTSQAAATPSSAANGSTAAARPRERLDMTPEESAQLYDAYDRCLGENGLPHKGTGAGSGTGAVPGRPDPAKEAAAEAACVGKKPLPPWEYDTANPQAADFLHKMVLCLRAKGVRLVEESPVKPGDDRTAIEFGGKDNDQDSITKGLNLTPRCEKELSSGGGR